MWRPRMSRQRSAGLRLRSSYHRCRRRHCRPLCSNVMAVRHARSATLLLLRVTGRLVVMGREVRCVRSEPTLGVEGCIGYSG